MRFTYWRAFAIRPATLRLMRSIPCLWRTSAIPKKNVLPANHEVKSLMSGQHLPFAVPACRNGELQLRMRPEHFTESLLFLRLKRCELPTRTEIKNVSKTKRLKRNRNLWNLL